jgi:hypothetical protein
MTPSVPTKPGEVALLESERAELSAELVRTRAAARRHTLWGLLGASPAALVPLIVTANHYGIAAAGGLCVLLAGVELWRGARLFNVAAGLETRLKTTSHALEAVLHRDGTGE